METSKLIHQGAIIDSVFQPTDQVLSVQTQESANILSILGSQSTEPYLANHFDRLTDSAGGQGDAKMAKLPPGKKDATMASEQQSGEARSVSTKGATADGKSTKTYASEKTEGS